MEKVKVSSEWTDEERLAVIAQLSILILSTHSVDGFRMKDLADLILKVSGFGPGFLEKNRANFSEVIE